jgi:hypothetical protein
MSFCPEAGRVFTDEELMATYSGPSVMPAAAERTGDTRMMTAAFLSSHMNKLKAAKIIPDLPVAGGKPKEAYATLKANIKAEYCYYDARYKFAIKRLITGIANAAGSDTKAALDRQLAICEKLNQKLKDMAQIVNAITLETDNGTKGMNKEIQSLNKEINEYGDKLKYQEELLRSNAPAVEIRKRMVEYTQEKAKATNNLLSLYFFLDVVALGMLFYVYKAS